jgi:hypothetical protein
MDDTQVRRSYVVVLKDYLVLQDSADTIAEHDPGARIVATSTAMDAVKALGGVLDVVVAFVEASPKEFAGSELARAIAARSGRVVLLGQAAEESSGQTDWPILSRPFRFVDVLYHLGSKPA